MSGWRSMGDLYQQYKSGDKSLGQFYTMIDLVRKDVHFDDNTKQVLINSDWSSIVDTMKDQASQDFKKEYNDYKTKMIGEVLKEAISTGNFNVEDIRKKIWDQEMNAITNEYAHNREMSDYYETLADETSNEEYKNIYEAYHRYYYSKATEYQHKNNIMPTDPAYEGYGVPNSTMGIGLRG